MTEDQDTPEKQPDKVAILMATYNGERFLAEQLDSILAQTYTHWTLYVQDDLSTDGTPTILHRYAAIKPRIKLLENSERHGAMRNFEELLKRVDAAYYMFSDQDDVWLPEKVERTLQFCKEIETHMDMADRPVAVCTDLRVVDTNLHEIGASFWKMQRIDPMLLTTLSRIGAHNFATGCTMLFNAEARRAALPFPTAALMHDAWLSLAVLHAGGILKGLNVPTMLYRQHEYNAIGATDETQHYVRGKLRHLPHLFSMNLATFRMLTCVQYGSIAKYLFNKWAYYYQYRRYAKVMPPAERGIISVCIATYNGAEVIREQLASILPQLSLTDEVIISDDGSTDGTLDTVRHFNSPIIRIVRGPAKHSPTLNFENALRQAKGDIIFLADQDDRWREDKVAVMLEALERADCVVSDCYVTNRDMDITASSFYALNGTKDGRFYNLFRKNGYQGCCMAFRRNVLETALPFPPCIPLHDIWIGNIAAFCHTVRFIPDRLIFFCRHGHNASVSADKSSFSFTRKLMFRLDTILPLLKRYFRQKGGITHYSTP